MAKAKLGIRPIIDGRWGGVRESLEEKTMSMALAAKKLIEENVFNSDGTPFECIISPCTIGGAAEAAKCADFFSTQNVCATLSVTPCWCYGSETMDLDPLTVKAVWGFNGTERPGAVYLAAVLAAHAQRGLPAFSIYGKDVQDVTDNSIPDDVAEKILRFARCAAAVGQLRGKSYVGIGAVAMGIAGSYCDADFWQEYLGIRAEWVDMVEVTRRVELGIYDHEEYERALKWVKENCPEGFDKNPENIRHTPEQKEKEWEFVVKMTLICRDIMLGNDKLNSVRPVGAEAEHSGPKDGWHEEALGRNAILGGFQGQRQWTDFMPNGDFTELFSTLPLTGTARKSRSPSPPRTTASTVCPCSSGSSSPAERACSPTCAHIGAPTRLKESAVCAPRRCQGRLYPSHQLRRRRARRHGRLQGQGRNAVMKEWWNVTDEDISAMLKATDWCPADLGYFRGGGYSSHFKTQAVMPMTMIRVNIIKGLGPVLQIAEGYTATLPDEIHNKLDMRTDPTWPTTWFAPRLTGKGAFKDVYSVMANWGANHGAISYGHIGKDLITLASMLRIPVAMHNVADEDIYRPHAWSAFGTKDLESADYRACAAYGPLYK